MAVWVLFGAILFAITEGWEVADAAYFSFITVSTIGFGDMVPGIENLDDWGKVKLIITGIYMLIGMALISMCFTLMQDEVVAKVAWLGEKLGITKKEHDDDDEDSDDEDDEWDPNDPYGKKNEEQMGDSEPLTGNRGESARSRPVTGAPRSATAKSRGGRAGTSGMSGQGFGEENEAFTDSSDRIATGVGSRTQTKVSNGQGDGLEW